MQKKCLGLYAKKIAGWGKMQSSKRFVNTNYLNYKKLPQPDMVCGEGHNAA